MNNEVKVLDTIYNKIYFSPSTKNKLEDDEIKEYKINNRLAKRLINQNKSNFKKRIIFIEKDNLVFKNL